MAGWLGLIAGGIAGTLSRYMLAGVVCQLVGTRFPYGTLLVNSLGCFLAGFLITLADGKLYLDANTRLLLFTGFCGAFTTFSTFILETAQLVREGQMPAAFVNITASVVAGFVLFALGVMLAELFVTQKVS